MKPVAVGLVHSPVLDKRGDRVVSAVTNVDIHDIARAARTYGVQRYYVITPAAEQQRLVGSILEHWCQGHGSRYNPARKEALSLVKVVATVQEALEDWNLFCDAESDCLLTSARAENSIGIEEARERLLEKPALILFGTGHGMAPELFERGWPVLSAIIGRGDYNHLSVRSAAAIILDRLLGRTNS